MTNEDDDTFEPHHSASPTDHVLTELQLYGFRPFHNEPDAACMWLAALLNPLPALGVAPEIRGHVLAKSDWHSRLDCVKKGVDASLENCARFARHASPEWDGMPTEEDVDVCRVQ